MEQLTIKLRMKPPVYPNFVKLEGECGEVTISIGALSDEELEEYAEAWKQGLIEHAKKRRDAYRV